MKIFISSVQKELAAERKALAECLSGDPLLRRFFDDFLFEDQPAADQRADQCYLEEVDRSEGAQTGVKSGPSRDQVGTRLALSGHQVTGQVPPPVTPPVGIQPESRPEEDKAFNEILKKLGL